MLENTPTRASLRAEAPKRRKRTTFVAFGLAVLAVGGIGAAATSAAWTDTVTFNAAAQGATFNLQGSLASTGPWTEGQPAVDGNASTIITIPADKFANLSPSETRTVTLFIKNDSSVAVNLTQAAAFATGATFTSNPALSISTPLATLPAGGTGSFVVTLTTPANWETTNKGKSGTVTVTVNGTSVTP